MDIADSHAGMHLVVWLKGKNAADGQALIAHAQQCGLGLHSIRPHYLEPPDRAGLLMGYCGLSVNEIEEALVLFARCLDEVYRQNLSQSNRHARASTREGTIFCRCEFIRTLYDLLQKRANEFAPARRHRR